MSQDPELTVKVHFSISDDLQFNIFTDQQDPKATIVNYIDKQLKEKGVEAFPFRFTHQVRSKNYN